MWDVIKVDNLDTRTTLLNVLLCSLSTLKYISYLIWDLPNIHATELEQVRVRWYVNLVLRYA